MVANRIYKHCIWEEEIRNWIKQHNLTATKELAAALYATAKFGKAIFPFSVQQQDEKTVLTYQVEPPASYTFAHADAVKILLNLLDDFLRDGKE
jgi:hypothetical protein